MFPPFLSFYPQLYICNRPFRYVTPHNRHSGTGTATLAPPPDPGRCGTWSAASQRRRSRSIIFLYSAASASAPLASPMNPYVVCW